MFWYCKQISHTEKNPSKLDTLDRLLVVAHYSAEKFDDKNYLLRKARFIAEYAHGHTLDSSGVPYFAHPKSVAEIVSLVAVYSDEVEAKTVAFLHDVMEDTFVTQEWLKKHFPPEIMDALMLLTHNKNNKSYIEYIKQIKDSGNQLAIDVKLADLAHNRTRFIYEDTVDGPIMFGKKRYQRFMKYSNAFDFLRGKEQKMQDVDDNMWSNEGFVKKILEFDYRAIKYVNESLWQNSEVQNIVGRVCSQKEIMTKIQELSPPHNKYLKRPVLLFEFSGDQSLIPIRLLQLIGEQIHASYSLENFKQYKYLVLQYANDEFDCYLLDKYSFDEQYKEITIDDVLKTNHKFTRIIQNNTDVLEIVANIKNHLIGAQKHKIVEMIKLSELGFSPEEEITIMSSWDAPMTVTGDAFVALDDDDKFHIVTADNNGLPNMYDLVQK